MLYEQRNRGLRDEEALSGMAGLAGGLSAQAGSVGGDTTADALAGSMSTHGLTQDAGDQEFGLQAASAEHEINTMQADAQRAGANILARGTASGDWSGAMRDYANLSNRLTDNTASIMGNAMGRYGGRTAQDFMRRSKSEDIFNGAEVKNANLIKGWADSALNAREKGKELDYSMRKDAQNNQYRWSALAQDALNRDAQREDTRVYREQMLGQGGRRLSMQEQNAKTAQEQRDRDFQLKTMQAAIKGGNFSLSPDAYIAWTNGDPAAAIEEYKAAQNQSPWAGGGASGGTSGGSRAASTISGRANAPDDHEIAYTFSRAAAKYGIPDADFMTTNDKGQTTLTQKGMAIVGGMKRHIKEFDNEDDALAATLGELYPGLTTPPTPAQQVAMAAEQQKQAATNAANDAATKTDAVDTGAGSGSTLPASGPRGMSAHPSVPPAPSAGLSTPTPTTSGQYSSALADDMARIKQVRAENQAYAAYKTKAETDGKSAMSKEDWKAEVAGQADISQKQAEFEQAKKVAAADARDRVAEIQRQLNTDQQPAGFLQSSIGYAAEAIPGMTLIRDVGRVRNWKDPNIKKNALLEQQTIAQAQANGTAETPEVASAMSALEGAKAEMARRAADRASALETAQSVKRFADRDKAYIDEARAAGRTYSPQAIDAANKGDAGLMRQEDDNKALAGIVARARENATLEDRALGKKPTTPTITTADILAARTAPNTQFGRGNIDLMNRPVVHNEDGSISTVATVSGQDDTGNEVLVPTITDGGRRMEPADAFKYWGKKGKNLGVFNTPGEATAYAQQLHEEQANQIVNQKKKKGRVITTADILANRKSRTPMAPTQSPSLEYGTTADGQPFTLDRTTGERMDGTLVPHMDKRTGRQYHVDMATGKTYEWVPDLPGAERMAAMRAANDRRRRAQRIGLQDSLNDQFLTR